MNKIYLYVPYEMKEQAKVLGAYYDIEKKSWWCYEERKNCVELFGRRNIQNTSYDKRHEYKRDGCMWDMEKRLWFTYNSNELI